MKEGCLVKVVRLEEPRVEVHGFFKGYYGNSICIRPLDGTGETETFSEYFWAVVETSREEAGMLIR